jgi:hypothetical protein
VTLFHSVTAAEDRVSGCGETPANFFSNYQARQGRFVVERAYRTFLPPGAGQQVIAEHMSWLVEDHSALAELVFDNVQNRVTYETHVDRDGDERTLRPGVEAEATPLGRLALRLLEPFGATSIEARPVLDGFGFLDLRLVINR